MDKFNCLHANVDMYTCPVSGKVLMMRCKDCGQEFERVAEREDGHGIFALVTGVQ